MKSKKSGGYYTGGKGHHGGDEFHQFDQRNASTSGHHGIVGMKHQVPSGTTGSSLPSVVKTTGGSQARTRTTTTGE